MSCRSSSRHTFLDLWPMIAAFVSSPGQTGQLLLCVRAGASVTALPIIRCHHSFPFPPSLAPSVLLLLSICARSRLAVTHGGEASVIKESACESSRDLVELFLFFSSWSSSASPAADSYPLLRE
ncbi:hypothetical protein GW17_00057888 [Ensete ventricosum]|nr:hypothetical protein GW17_00057888 [Ensete ventricosum]